MKLAVLFTGGKDSTLAMFLAKKNGYEIPCLITIYSENSDSFMYHTPSITQVKKQAEKMNLPLIFKKTKGEKEIELKELEQAILEAKEKYSVDGVITGAIRSDYQAQRIQKICDKLDLKCLNPLWYKNQFEVLKLLIKHKFEVIITRVAAYPLDFNWLGRKINEKFIQDVKELNEKYKINPAGEGGEFETFVLNCPLFSKGLKVIDKKITGSEYDYTLDIVVE